MRWRRRQISDLGGGKSEKSLQQCACANVYMRMTVYTQRHGICKPIKEILNMQEVIDVSLFDARHERQRQMQSDTAPCHAIHQRDGEVAARCQRIKSYIRSSTARRAGSTSMPPGTQPSASTPTMYQYFCVSRQAYSAPSQQTQHDEKTNRLNR